MLSPAHALRGAGSLPIAPASAARTVALVGGGGALGSAVLEALLGTRRFARVKVLVSRALTTAMPGLEPVVVDRFDAPPGPATPPIADTALLVFDRERRANGRELAFVRPQPRDLPGAARWLHARGVRHLIVLLPHAPATLPDALKRGLANLNEQAVAALGFEHLVFVRPAQDAARSVAGSWPQRVADGVLAQLRLMVAASNQPVRAPKVARFVLELAVALPASAPGTRVAAPELVWQAAQLGDPQALVQAWLGHRAWPAVVAPPPRL
jgi:hypothetical protein